MNDNNLEQLQAFEIREHYNQMQQRFGQEENTYMIPVMSESQEVAGTDVSMETFAYVQGLLGKVAHIKLNLKPNAEVPVDYLLENARIDGAITALRGLLDAFHETRQKKVFQNLTKSSE